METGPNTAETFPLRTVQILNWLLLAALAGVGWAGWSARAAVSILIGGIVANISFLLLKRDLIRLLGGPLQAAKVRFFIKYYARLAGVVLVLFLLVRHRQVDAIAVLVGLSTVLFSIAITVVGEARKVYAIKEAA